MVVTLLLAALAAVACSNPGPRAEGETHWLEACVVDEDCGGGACICNVCTATCDGDASCQAAATPARCFHTRSASLELACADGEAVDGVAICLADCTSDADCFDAQSCQQGACIPAPPSAKSVDDIADAKPGLDPRAFLDAQVSLDFTQPHVVPVPQLVLTGNYPELAGEWQESCDGETDHTSIEAHHSGCMRMLLEPSADGSGLVGVVTFTGGDAETNRVAGPFEPASAPTEGYPPGMEPSDHHALYQIEVPGVTYRVFDARYDGAELSFWTSPRDLWTAWCELQTSYPVTVNGNDRYRCVPSDATPGSVGVEKFQLCTEWDVPECDSSADNPISCAGSACTCGPDGCTSAIHRTRWVYTLTLQDETMRSTSLKGMLLNQIGLDEVDPAAGLYLDAYTPLRLRRVIGP